MTDKKSCENCLRKLTERICADCDMLTHSHWIRNPQMWLAILPTEPGWYWWRANEDAKPTVIELYSCSKKLCKTGFQVNYSGSECWEFLRMIDEGEFQGPIEPNNEGEK